MSRLIRRGVLAKQSSGGVVTPDAFGTAFENSLAGPFTNTSLTIGTGNALVVALFIQNGSTTTSGFTWNGVALTQIGTDTVNLLDRTLRLYGLLNSGGLTAGNQNLVLTISSATRVSFGAMSFNGVNQTFGTGFANFTSLVDNTQTTNVISRTVTSASGHYGFAIADAFGSVSDAINQTTLCSFVDNTGGAVGYGAASGNITFTATATNATDILMMAAMDIAP